MNYIVSKTNFSWLLLLSMLIIVSCDTVVEIELGEAEQMIVLNTVINPDSLIKVKLTRNRHILDNAPIMPLEPPAYYPVVKLFVDNEFAEDLNFSSNGTFESTIKPVQGCEYSLLVEEPKLTNVSASGQVPSPVKISGFDTLTYIQEIVDADYGYYGNEKFLEVSVEIDDPVGIDNYYMLGFSADKSYWQWRDTSFFVVDSALVDGRWIYDFREILGYEKYARQIYHNLCYASNDISSQFAVHCNYVFSDIIFDGQNYKYKAKIPLYNLYALDSTIVQINLMSLSEDYYKYLRTKSLHYESRDDFFTTPVSVFNNIEGGAGIFGAYSVSKKMFSVKAIDPWARHLEEGEFYY